MESYNTSTHRSNFNPLFQEHQGEYDDSTSANQISRQPVVETNGRLDMTHKHSLSNTRHGI